ncbi:MAG TPA: response regulator [Kiritimatiellia bacterium]|nr:response regulator [Kiritimatiellia bacterium]
MTAPKSPSSTPSELEARIKALHTRLFLPDSVCQPSVAPHFRHFDLSFARSLLSIEDSFVESRRIFDDVLLKSSDGRTLCHAARLDLLERLSQATTEIDHPGPFGIHETLYPVRVRGHLIHAISSGPYRTHPFSDNDLTEIAFLGGVPLERAREAAASLPILSGSALDACKQTLAAARDLATHAITEHLRAAKLNAQALQSERLNSLGSLAEGMAHHFNNLLSIILGYASLLLDRESTPESSTQALRSIAEAAQRGRRFTEEVLNISSLVGEEDEQWISLHERIHAVLSLLRPRIGRDIDISLHLDAPCDTVIAPSGAIHQIIFNLINGALDAMPYGGQLIVRTETLPPAHGEPESLRLTLTDSGEALRHGQPAISPARRTLLEQDLGPKLASVLGIVARLDGSLKVTGSAAVGSVVDITLPLSREKPDLHAVRERRKHLAPSRIWIADDDPTVREMCRHVLEESGHQVHEVDSGAAARSQIETNTDSPPELLIYDFNMPDLSGSEFISWLRQDTHRKTPILFISGLPPEHPGIKAALKFRKTFHLNKPFTLREMADQVTVALGETLIGE